MSNAEQTAALAAFTRSASLYAMLIMRLSSSQSNAARLERILDAVVRITDIHFSLHRPGPVAPPLVALELCSRILVSHALGATRDFVLLSKTDLVATDAPGVKQSLQHLINCANVWLICIHDINAICCHCRCLALPPQLHRFETRSVLAPARTVNQYRY